MTQYEASPREGAPARGGQGELMGSAHRASPLDLDLDLNLSAKGAIPLDLDLGLNLSAKGAIPLDLDLDLNLLPAIGQSLQHFLKKIFPSMFTKWHFLECI